jgi:O-antigen/teichoic acid export membrane protein
MRSFRSLGSQFGEAFLLQVAAVGLLFCFHVVAARLGGPDAYGVFSYALTIAGFLSVFSTLGLANTSIRFVAGYCETSDWAFLNGLLKRCIQLIVAVSVPVGFLLFCVGFVIQNSDSRTAFLYAGVLLPIISIGFWRGAANRGFQHVRHSLMPEEILRPLFFISICAILYLIGTRISIGWLISIHYVSCIVALVIGMRWLVSDIPLECKNGATKYSTRVWLNTSFPIMIAGMFQELLTRADLLALGMFGTMEAIGLYSAASRLSMLNIFPLRVVDTVIPPKISAAFHAGNLTEVHNLIRRGMMISTAGAFPLFAVMLVFPAQILAIFGPDYVGASNLLRILALGQFVNALTGPVGYALLMTGQEKFYRNVVAVVATFSTVGYLIAIKYFGALGAAWVMCISVILLNVTLFLGVKRRIVASTLDPQS